MRVINPRGRIALTASIMSALLLVVILIWELYQHWPAFLAWKANAGVLPFFLGLTLLPLVGVPSTPLFVLAGVTFGLQTALVGCSLAIALNLLLSYWLARRWMHNWLARLLVRWNFKPPSVGADNKLTILLLVRTTPGLPSALRNYAAALIDVPFPVYMLVSWTTTLLYAVGLVVLGDSLSNASLAEAGIAVALLAVVLGAILWFLKYQQKNRNHRGRQVSRSETDEV